MQSQNQVEILKKYMRKQRNLHKLFGIYIWVCSKKKSFMNFRQKKIKVKKRKIKNLYNHTQVYKTIENKIQYKKIQKIFKINKRKNKKYKIKITEKTVRLTFKKIKILKKNLIV